MSEYVSISIHRMIYFKFTSRSYVSTINSIDGMEKGLLKYCLSGLINTKFMIQIFYTSYIPRVVCRTGLNRLGETGLNRQVSAGRNREKLGET